jgi:1-aminocyclopropane-1-carboxylate deaminase/D-cysteine desulfhydrase-like pyridoxal-dependent ACC family enzyme
MPAPTPQEIGLLALGAAGASAVCCFCRPAAPPSSSQAAGDGEAEEYKPPTWVAASGLTVPSHRLRLAHLPTPIHRWRIPHVDEQASEVWIKRDDCTGCELSGNKVRKLEFLLADALRQGATAVITVGGIQSNHCRATAAAARRVGLQPHIILRTAHPGQDPGLVGNLMLDRMVGATIHLVGEEEFAAKGGWGLVCELQERLKREEGVDAYAFPSDGSNALGAWGYVEALAEIQQQVRTMGVHFDCIYFACGSGGTAAGLAAGLALSGMGGHGGTELVALGVDDTPEEVCAAQSARWSCCPDLMLSLHILGAVCCLTQFFDKIDGIFRDMR